MASFTTTIERYATRENAVTYIMSGSHSFIQPRLVIQKRAMPNTANGVQRHSLEVLYGTTDSDDNPLNSLIGMAANIRYPSNGDGTDVVACLATFRDFVNSDEFQALVLGGNLIQP